MSDHQQPSPGTEIVPARPAVAAEIAAAPLALRTPDGVVLFATLTSDGADACLGQLRAYRPELARGDWADLYRDGWRFIAFPPGRLERD